MVIHLIGKHLRRDTDQRPPDGPAAGIGIAPVWNEMMDIYYREMGWDRASGKPLPDTLLKLDLASIIPDLWSE